MVSADDHSEDRRIVAVQKPWGDAMPPIRVVLVGMSTMLREVVQALVQSDPLLELAGECDSTDLQDAMSFRPDVLVISTEEVSETELIEFLTANGTARILGISATSGKAALYEMCPHRVPLGELGVQSLATALVRRPDGV
jgi:hypothetical protein